MIGDLHPPHLIRETVADGENLITFFKSADKSTYNTAHNIPEFILAVGQCQYIDNIHVKAKILNLLTDSI